MKLKLKIVFTTVSFSQKKLNFFTKSDTLHIKRRNAIIITESVLVSGTLLVLGKIWYANRTRSNFHIINDILNTFRFSESLANLFFLLSRHKFSSIALVTVVNFNANKRKKKKLKIRKAKCIEYSDYWEQIDKMGYVATSYLI